VQRLVDVAKFSCAKLMLNIYNSAMKRKWLEEEMPKG